MALLGKTSPMATSSGEPLTPQSDLRQFILIALRDLGGSAPRAVVLGTIEDRFGEGFTRGDWEEVRTRPGEEKWKNRASYERNKMKNDGLLVARADGTWQLTEKGRDEAARLP